MADGALVLQVRAGGSSPWLLVLLCVGWERGECWKQPQASDCRHPMQSKASCMPAHALAPHRAWAVVDACAAPGNKTTHLAALMGNRGSIVAFEVGGWVGGWAVAWRR